MKIDLTTFEKIFCGKLTGEMRTDFEIGVAT